MHWLTICEYHKVEAAHRSAFLTPASDLRSIVKRRDEFPANVDSHRSQLRVDERLDLELGFRLRIWNRSSIACRLKCSHRDSLKLLRAVSGTQELPSLFSKSIKKGKEIQSA